MRDEGEMCRRAQSRIFDWPGIDYRSAVVKTIHVRARGGERPRKLTTINRNETENE